MFNPSKSTALILSAFLATSTVMIAGCSQEQNDNYLVDDNGQRYELVQNSDGTETAKYENGESVTFKRQEDGSIDYVSGAAGLLAGMMAGYFLFHGLSPASGSYYDSARNKYVVTERPRRMSSSERKEKLNEYKDTKTKDYNGGGGAAVTSSSSKSSSNSSKSNVSSSSNKSSNSSAKSSSSASSAKSGFGSAGARSAAS